MSVIIESEKGDGLICIEEFEGPPDGERPSEEKNRVFRIGERVRYLGFYQDQNLQSNPVCWMVRFEAGDGKQYSATQTYFVTEDCWHGIAKFFAKRVLRQPKAKPATTKQPK